MRTIDPAFQAQLDSGTTKMCRCWRVERRDGVTTGYTDHDADLSFEGTLFQASSGLNASALQATTGLAVDNAQAIGALSDAGIHEADIASGRYDRAAVAHWLVDWTDPTRRVLLFSGHFGEIRRKDGIFEVELRGLTDALNVPVGRAFQRYCDRRLGDAKCGFALDTPGFSAEASVASLPSAASLVAEVPRGFDPGWFAFGTVTWLSGANTGDVGSIKADTPVDQDARRLDLWVQPGAPMAVGDRFVVHAGCDKRMATCRDKFSNLLNFRGFPHIPGDDWVAAYPKNGEVHDGASRERG